MLDDTFEEEDVAVEDAVVAAIDDVCDALEVCEAFVDVGSVPSSCISEEDSLVEAFGEC